MPTDSNPTSGIDLATIPDFKREYAKLESLVKGGTATPVEQIVYLVTTLAVQSAREIAELYGMLEQQRTIGGVVYVTSHYPQKFRNHFIYAGRLYQVLIDTLPRGGALTVKRR